jgi:hypothetical protein
LLREIILPFLKRVTVSTRRIVFFGQVALEDVDKDTTRPDSYRSPDLFPKNSYDAPLSLDNLGAS